MSSASRKVKNPLLSAAGEGFPFENYSENALLVPVTPATPAVLRDDAELDSFIGQEPTNSHGATVPATTAPSPSEFTPIPLHSEDVKTSPSQPVKQGYLTSILSSLPNLSLSSITGDSSASQANEATENVDTTQNTNPFVPAHDQRDSLRNVSPPIVPNFLDPRRTNYLGSAEVNAGNTKNLSAPPQPTLPPTVPSSGPISYRLGNQRRLKYAPPPDLTSSTTKQYTAPAVQPLFTSQGVLPPTIFNPNEVAAPIQSYQPPETLVSTNSPSVQQSTPEQLSQANSLQASFRSSPVTTGIPYSSACTPRSITPQSQNSTYENVSLPGKPAIPQSASRCIPSKLPEPATPQNTPANVSFSGFDFYASQRNFAAVNADKETVGIKDLSSQVDSQSQISSNSIAGSTTEPRTGATFTPISAVQVTKKLEHLLAEQKDDLSDSPSDVPLNPDEHATVSAAVENLDDKKSNNIGEETNLNFESVTDAFSGHELPKPPEVTVPPTEADRANVNVDPTQSHGTSPNVPFFQQYYQPPPLASGPNFFVDGQKEQKSNSSYTRVTEASVPNTFSDSKAFAPSPSSFFNTQSTTASFFHSQPKEDASFSKINPGLLKSEPQQAPQSTSFNVHFANPEISAFQSQSDVNPVSYVNSATCSTVVQSPAAPIFYNPAQFKNDLQNQEPPAIYSQFSAATQPTVNQTHHYFENLATSGSQETFSEVNNIYYPPSPVMTTVPEPTGSATLNPIQMSINPQAGRSTTDSVPPSFQQLAAGPSDKRMQYRVVYHHWFYRKEVEHKVLWLPFSMQDSLRLEEVHNSSEITPETTVATDGGRYDVDILRRQRSPVYWNGASTEVRRCSWFFKGLTESRYIPYDESTAAKLEEEYKQACSTNNWNRRIDLSNGEHIIFHSATVQVHYSTTTSPELAASWGNSAGSEDSTYLQGAGSRPRVIKRGLDEFHIDDGEPEKVDHLLFLVHGIGSVCDLKFRSVEEVVDEFRSISLQLVQSHYRTASEQRIVNRIEVLPISWHTTLHSEDTGIDKKLQAITLESIPKLRHFTNDTLLDILFYTSPVYCQTIMQTVGSEVNRLYTLFKGRNPDFNGGIYLGGHSLGSLILFDLLCHQKPVPDNNRKGDDTEADEEQNDEDADSSQLSTGRVLKRRLSKKISYVVGAAGTGQPCIHYPQLNFQPRAFFALGSPIGMFVTVRGIDMLGEDFVLPTCPAFFNIFHPFDPVAYRVEALINPDASKFRPMLIPHHKGRKRMHLELKETMARVGADLKQKLLDSVRSTWNSVYQLTVFHKPDNTILEREIDKVVEEQLQKTPTLSDQNNDDGGADFKVGNLNGGRRIDYVLQEAPFEYINEYIFALTSHVCYWESEDTMLMILKEIYGSAGIQTDAQLPQQTLSIERVTASSSLLSSPSTSTKSNTRTSVPIVGMDPTAPISEKSVGPPPKSGFVRKS